MTVPTMGGDLSHTAHDVMSWNPTDPPITIDQMLERDKLVSVDQGRQILGSTEPLAYVNFETGDQVRFRVEEGWNSDLAVMHGTTPVSAYMSIGPTGASHEYQLSYDALHQAASTFSYGKGLVDKSPGHLTEDALNWWFRTGLDKKLQLMVVGQDQLGSALTRDSIQPFSNLELLDKALETIEARFPDTRVFVDRNKLSHSLRATYLQLVLPDVAHMIEGSGEVDDRWWGGLQVTNSLTAEKQTGVDAFLFRQRCTNGYIDAMPESRWSRKTQGQDSGSVMAWAASAVDEALGSFEGIFERVQGLVGERIDPNRMGQTANNLFEQYRIPVAARERIMANLVETDQLTMYALTNAVTQAANGAVGVQEQQRLMRTGGDVIRNTARCDSCHQLAPAGVEGHDH